MKRYFALLLVLLTAAATALAAEENIRAMQTRLKEGGFYFGEINGQNTSDTAAALTRYQIRNGLPVSGKLDPETSKALGLAGGGTEAVPAPAPESNAWRNLRKSDQQFLEKLDAGKIPPPGSSATPAPIPPARAEENSAAPPEENVRRSSASAPPRADAMRERLRDYVAGFVLAGLDPHVGSELEFFGNSVNYYGEKNVGREQIRRDLISYDRKWPVRQFRLVHDLDIVPLGAGRVRVSFNLRYDLRNGGKHASGKIRKTLVLSPAGDDYEIAGVNEAKAR